MTNKTFIKEINRRRFLQTSAMGVAGISLLPGMMSCKPKVSANNDIRLGFIGLGQQAKSLWEGFLPIPGVKILAGSDVYDVKCKRFVKKITDYYTSKSEKVKVDTYEKYQDLLARKDIDAVVVATPDHYHAIIAIEALKAGKDVYLEKPLTFTIREGQELRKIVRESNRILAVGSMQRSDLNFQHAVKLVRDGALGKISKAYAHVGPPPGPYDLPEEPIPAGLNWDLWLGPLPASIHFNNKLNPPISLDPEKDETMWGGWRFYKGMGGGRTTDWGAHMFDIVQWGLGMDDSGPVEISPVVDADPSISEKFIKLYSLDPSTFDVNTQFITFKYADGTIMTSEPFDEKLTRGVKFTGENGWLEVSRGHFLASNPEWLPPKREDPKNIPVERRRPHLNNFIDSVRDHVDPVATVEIGHRSCTVCNLGNLALDLRRTIKWNPAGETFSEDTDGTLASRLQYNYREGYRLL